MFISNKVPDHCSLILTTCAAHKESIYISLKGTAAKKQPTKQTNKKKTADLILRVKESIENGSKPLTDVSRPQGKNKIK